MYKQDVESLISNFNYTCIASIDQILTGLCPRREDTTKLQRESIAEFITRPYIMPLKLF